MRIEIEPEELVVDELSSLEESDDDDETSSFKGFCNPPDVFKCSRRSILQPSR
jgi:hypothetical protein